MTELPNSNLPLATRRTVGAAVIAISMLPGMAAAADWTQFRGANGSGASDDSCVPVKWSKTENIRWTAELPGRGLSCPVITGNKVFLTACDGPGQRKLIVLCFDVQTGKKLWQRSIWATGGTNCHPKTCMAAPTPVTDGTNVYALFATADLAAFDGDGNLLWYRSLTGDYPGITNQVGMAASPVLAPGALIVPMENSGDSFIAALDPKTGHNVWKTERPRDINWVTPAVRLRSNRTEIIFQDKDEMVAYNAANGERLWSFGSRDRSEIPSPVLMSDGAVLATGAELVALKPGNEGETPTVLWKSNRLKVSGYPTPLYYRGRVYGLNSIGVLTCADANDGKVLWQERAKGPVAASPVAADGHIYVVSEKGVTTVIKAGDKPQIEGTNDLGDEFLATPAIANGCIFLRSDQKLYCIGLSQK
jgi:outer membrane protein assembly factor BamB